MFSRLFPRHKARPDQAGFIRRGLAFSVDAAIIGILSMFIYLVYFEIRASISGEPGLIAQMSQAIKEGSGFSIRMEEDEADERIMKQSLLKILKEKISEEEYGRAEDMSAEELYHAYEQELIAAGRRHKLIYVGEMFNIIQEYFITLLYFVFFFHFGGRTLGKRIFRLQVVDLKGKPRLGWYQSFERAHGYVCSGLFASLGFWQVLWNQQGLSMHDKIADTTVIKLPRKKRVKKPKKTKEKTGDQPA
ncbi:MAG: RDD family protein [Candidatus Aminicenantes bacterium]|nr:RDD family protein [Candidatus Aminicenantes bacterium]